MKRIFRSLMALAIAVVTLAACSSSDDVSKYVADVSVPATVPTTQEGYLLLEAGAHEFTFDIKTEGKWTVTSQNRFLHVKNGSGTGNGTVNIEVENNTFEDRKIGHLAITFPGHESENKTITVEQKYLGDYGGNAADQLDTSNQIYAVGFGYDCKGEWASPRSVRGQIFRTKELIDSGLIAKSVSQIESSDYTVTGSTISEVSNKLTVKASVEGSYGAFKGEASASFNMDTSEKNTYEYASTYFDMQTCRASITTGIESLIMNYMTDDAYSAINGLSVETKSGSQSPYTKGREGLMKLIRDYGTHLVVEAGLGGRLRRSIEVNITEITGAYDVKAFAKASYDGVCKADASVDEEYKQSYEKNEKKVSAKVDVLGGNSKLATKLTDKEYFKRENFLAWKESVDSTNMTLINFSDHSLIPLYDLVNRSLPGGEVRYKEIYDYMTKGNMAQDFSTYKCGTVTEFDVPSFEGAKYNETLIKDIYLGGQWVGQVCNEYIPIINRNERVTVIYPVISNQPRYSMGFFLGDDKGHKPARVSWNNNNTDVAVEEYEDLDFGKATHLYLRGASVMAKLPEGTTAKKAEKAVDKYLEGLRFDPSIDADRQGKYPLVKIFNKVWTRETYKHYVGSHVSKTYTVSMDGDDVQVTNVCYYPGVAADGSNWPSGWQVASSREDYEPMFDKLVANGFSYPARALFNGGVTGFELCFEGWNQENGYAWIFDKQIIGTRDGIGVVFEKNGVHGLVGWQTNRFPVRLVKVQ